MGLGKVLIDRPTIEAGVDRLASAIARDFAGRNLLVVGVLKGSIFLLADLTRRLGFPVQIEMLRASSYRNSATSSGEVRITADVGCDVRGRDILLVEDIIDTGLTLRHVCQEFEARGARSVKVCALLRKASARNAETPADYVGFEIDDVFVVGYGLDYAEQYRNLYEVRVFDPTPA